MAWLGSVALVVADGKHTRSSVTCERRETQRTALRSLALALTVASHMQSSKTRLFRDFISELCIHVRVRRVGRSSPCHTNHFCSHITIGERSGILRTRVRDRPCTGPRYSSRALERDIDEANSSCSEDAARFQILFEHLAVVFRGEEREGSTSQLDSPLANPAS